MSSQEQVPEGTDFFNRAMQLMYEAEKAGVVIKMNMVTTSEHQTHGTVASVIVAPNSPGEFKELMYPVRA